MVGEVPRPQNDLKRPFHEAAKKLCQNPPPAAAAATSLMVFERAVAAAAAAANVVSRVARRGVCYTTDDATHIQDISGVPTAHVHLSPSLSFLR